jgi:hypothetical protein
VKEALAKASAMTSAMFFAVCARDQQTMIALAAELGQRFPAVPAVGPSSAIHLVNLLQASSLCHVPKFRNSPVFIAHGWTKATLTQHYRGHHNSATSKYRSRCPVPILIEIAGNAAQYPALDGITQD